MGDRGNVVFKQRNGNDLWLYTHWTGSELKNTVKKALARRQRWDDEPYLTRIVFCEMIKGHESGETGFGISTYKGDGGALITINCTEQTVAVGDKKAKSFEEFVK